MGAIYAGEPVPRPSPDTRDSLAEVAPIEHGNVTGTGTLDIPIASMPYHRPSFGTMLSAAPQDLDLGIEVPQAGSGRPFIPARLTFPNQSLTPVPDGRRIARPMPTAARDETQVIR